MLEDEDAEVVVENDPTPLKQELRTVDEPLIIDLERGLFQENSSQMVLPAQRSVRTGSAATDRDIDSTVQK